MRRWIGVAVVLGALVGVAGTGWLLSESRAQRITRDQPAPAIAGGPWINSEPLTLEKLRGRVVFIEFWTYG